GLARIEFKCHKPRTGSNPGRDGIYHRSGIGIDLRIRREAAVGACRIELVMFAPGSDLRSNPNRLCVLDIADKDRTGTFVVSGCDEMRIGEPLARDPPI